MDLNLLTRIKPNVASPARNGGKDVAEAAEQFEGMIIGQLLEPMWAGIKTDGAFGGGQGEMVFRSLMIQEMGKSIAKNGGLGVADDVRRTLLQMQEAAAK